MTDHISAKSFLVLQRDRSGQGSERRRDYRPLGGMTIPFTTVPDHPLMGRIVGTVKDVRFDVEIPAAAFRASR